MLLDSRLEGEQSATSKLSGTTSGSTSSFITLVISKDGSQIDVKGHASTSADRKGTAESSSKTAGYVRKTNSYDKEDAKYIANSSVGITAAQGNGLETTTEAWGSSRDGGPDGQSANAGHSVAADGVYTGSTGDQVVALLSEKP